MTISIGLLTLYLDLPGCTSLKEKRSRIKPLLARLHKEFNISAAEVERQDAWQEAVIAVAIVSNASTHNQQALAQVVQFIERKWPDATLMDQTLELI